MPDQEPYIEVAPFERVVHGHPELYVCQEIDYMDSLYRFGYIQQFADAAQIEGRLCSAASRDSHWWIAVEFADATCVELELSTMYEVLAARVANR